MSSYFALRASSESKRARTRGCLLDSAIEVFAKRGVGGATIQEIARLAGLAITTFYNHFRDKDQLARETALAIASEAAAAANAAMAQETDPVRRLAIGSASLCHFARAHRTWAEVMVDAASTLRVDQLRFLDYAAADLTRGAAEGRFKVSVDDFLLDQLNALFLASLRYQLRTSMDSRYQRRVCEHALRMLGVPPAQAAAACKRAEALLSASHVSSDHE